MFCENEENFKFGEILSLIFEIINDLICILDPQNDYKFELINQMFLNALNFTNKDLIGKSILNYIYPDDVKKVIKNFKKKTEFRSNLQEIRIKDKSGDYKWFELKIKKVKDDNNQKKLLLILKNISDRKDLECKINEIENKFKILSNLIPEIRFWKLFYPKKYEEALQLSYDMLQMVIENIPQFIFWKDTNLTYLGCNKNYAKFIAAKQPEYIIGRTDKELLFNKEKAAFLQKHETEIIKSDWAEYHSIEPWVLESGDQILLDANRIPLHDSKGKIIGILGTYENITLLKKAEQKLKESEEKYRLISENANDMIAILNSKSEYEYINEQTFLNILGYSKDDLIGKSALILVHPDDFKRNTKALRHIYKYGDSIEELRIKHKNGSYIWVETKGKLFKNKDGELKAILISREITKRKITEEKLRKSEEKYRFLFEKGPFSIILFNSDGIIIDCNPTTQKLFEYKKTELIGRHFKNVSIIHQKYSPIFFKLFNEFLKGEKLNRIDLPLYKKDGSFIWANLQLSLVNISNKMFVQGIFRDITEKREAEEALKESEEKYRLISENANDLIIVLNQKLILEYVNKSFLTVLNYSSEEVFGKTPENFLHPEDYVQSINALKEGFIKGEGIEIVRIKRKDGHYIWFEVKGKTFIDKTGEKKALLILRDITERKKAEQDLKISEEK
ncbi:MAG: PAS domain S-box protein, partial [Promethearchaeota archaeon]